MMFSFGFHSQSFAGSASQETNHKNKVITAAGASLFEYHAAFSTLYSSGILTWPDLTPGGSRHQVAAGQASSPTLSSSSAMNGRACLQFSGSQSTYGTASASAYVPLHDGVQPAAIIAVTAPQAGSFKFIVGTHTTASNPGVGLLVNPTNNVVARIGDGSASYQATSTSAISAAVASLRSESSLIHYDLDDGTTSGTGSTGVAQYSSSNGQTLSVGSTPGGTAYFTGEICEVVVLVGHTAQQYSNTIDQLSDFYLS